MYTVKDYQISRLAKKIRETPTVFKLATALFWRIIILACSKSLCHSILWVKPNFESYLDFVYIF